MHSYPGNTLSLRRGLGCVMLFTLLATSVNAAPILTPTTKSDHDAACKWTATLNPSPARREDYCPWVANGLEAQGYDTDHGWTITTGAELKGSVDIEKYYAWVTDDPVINIGGTNYGGRFNDKKAGGAVLQLSYTPGEGDPSGADLHWIQGIYTNDPSQHGQDRGYEGTDGYTQYIDNGGNFDDPVVDPPNPFYDTSGVAGSDYFLDIPVRECEADCDTEYDWEAQVFLATADIANKKITMYESGIWWGFEFKCEPLPEPATFVLLLAGMLIASRRAAHRG